MRQGDGNPKIQLATNITGAPRREHFTVAETELDGEVLVRTDYLGLAATYLELMRSDCHLPIPAWQPGQRIGVMAIGTVLRSASPDLQEGDLVQSMTGWSTHSAGPAASYVKLDPDAYPDPSYHLGQGPTAYYGMADVTTVGPGDVVFVSGAAGGVGSLAAQTARNLGASKVIGSAGSQAKVDYVVRELGLDAAFDYHEDRLPADGCPRRHRRRARHLPIVAARRLPRKRLGTAGMTPLTVGVRCSGVARRPFTRHRSDGIWTLDRDVPAAARDNLRWPDFIGGYARHPWRRFRGPNSVCALSADRRIQCVARLDPRRASIMLLNFRTLAAATGTATATTAQRVSIFHNMDRSYPATKPIMLPRPPVRHVERAIQHHAQGGHAYRLPRCIRSRGL